jgi:hypothetical protein
VNPRWGWPPGFAIVQFPNPPLIIALLASVAGHFTDGVTHQAALSVFYVSLSIWAYQEALHGVNWFRHVLGLGFSVYIVVSLVQRLHG